MIYKSVAQAERAAEVLDKVVADDLKKMLKAQGMASQLRDAVDLTFCVLKRSERRVLRGEKVSAIETTDSILSHTPTEIPSFAGRWN